MWMKHLLPGLPLVIYTEILHLGDNDRGIPKR